ncbi:hypothetical protein B484DRAFT_395024 [Ochromonadaceae sp. CCMP2298]|nr:hypothetical protein B484DRAFT_395024 [Ochromonadaceae sp. CCMP2298]
MAQKLIYGACQEGCAMGCPQFLSSSMDEDRCAFCNCPEGQHLVAFILGAKGEILYSNATMAQQSHSQQPRSQAPPQSNPERRTTNVQPAFSRDIKLEEDVVQFIKIRPAFAAAKDVLGYMESTSSARRPIAILDNKRQQGLENKKGRGGDSSSSSSAGDGWQLMEQGRNGQGRNAPPVRATVNQNRTSALKRASAPGKVPSLPSLYVRRRVLERDELHFPDSEFAKMLAIQNGNLLVGFNLENYPDADSLFDSEFAKMLAIQNGTLLVGFNLENYPDADSLFARLLSIQFNRLGPVGFGGCPTCDFYFWRVEGGAKRGKLIPLGFGSVNYPTIAQDWDLLSTLEFIICTPDLKAETEPHNFPDTRLLDLRRRDESVNHAATMKMIKKNQDKRADADVDAADDADVDMTDRNSNSFSAYLADVAGDEDDDAGTDAGSARDGSDKLEDSDN